MSISTPASMASSAASFLSLAAPWFLISSMAAQSEITAPLKPISSRSTLRISHLFAEEGIRFKVLKEVITNRAPAFTAAS